MITRKFEPGQIIFREGEDSADAFYILTGRVRIRLRTAEGPCVLAELGPGEIFGEMGMIEDAPRSATAEAVQLTEVEVIGEAQFAASILRRPERLHRFLGTLFERLRHTSALVRAQRSSPLPGALTGADVDPALAPRFTMHLRSLYDETASPAPPIDLEIDKLPFLIGRDCGGAESPFTFNDLNLPDKMPFQISRHHCAIEQRGRQILVRDRGSTVGTLVNGQPVGVRYQVVESPLVVGSNELVLGEAMSPHRFALTVRAAEPPETPLQSRTAR